MQPLIIHHASCIDGWTAAWAAHLRLRERAADDGGPVEAELVAAHYGDAPPDVTGRQVVIVDFSYPRDVLAEMHEKAATLLVLDHHQTAAAALDGLPYAVFDLKRSGAGLAWDVLHPGRPRPWVINYVEDRDLWRWALPRSREVSAYLRTLEFDLEVWAGLVESSWESAADKGEAIVVYIEQIVRKHAKHAVLHDFAGHRVPIVNATACVSEIGNALSKEAPFAVTWQALNEGGYVYSLRSSGENPDHVDVSEIAKAFGGGGHKHAAGFKSPTMVHARA